MARKATLRNIDISLYNRHFSTIYIVVVSFDASFILFHLEAELPPALSLFLLKLSILLFLSLINLTSHSAFFCFNNITDASIFCCFSFP